MSDAVFMPARLWQWIAGKVTAPIDSSLLFGIGLAIVAGTLCAVAPWWLPLGFLLGLGLLVTTAKYPFFGLVVCFLLTYQAIPSGLVPEIPLGFFKLKPYELIFLWTIFAFLVRSAFSRNSETFVLPRFTMPMLFVFVCVVVGVVDGKYFRGNGDLVLAEARGFLGLLAAPMIQLIVRDRDGVDRLSFWISLTAVVLSIYVVVQAVTGMRILDGRVEPLDQGRNADVTRSVIVGIYIQGFALYHMTLSLKTGRRIRYWLVPLILIVLLGLLATFTRGAWVAAAIGGLVAAYLAWRWRGVFIAAALGAIMVAATVSAAYVLKPRVAEAAVERALGIGRELREGGSFGYRQIENEQALRVIKEHPLLGVGIGGTYKDVASSGGHFELEYYFIHNSYLFFPLKMGLVAGLGPLFIAGAFFLMVLRISRKNAGQVGSTVAVCAGVVTMIFIGAIEGPHLISFPGLLILGTALALVATTYSSMPRRPDASSQRSKAAEGSAQLRGRFPE